MEQICYHLVNINQVAILSRTPQNRPSHPRLRMTVIDGFLMKITSRSLFLRWLKEIYMHICTLKLIPIYLHFHGQNIPVSIPAINNIKHIESVFEELALVVHDSKSKNTKQSFHIPRTKEHIKEIINDSLTI